MALTNVVEIKECPVLIFFFNYLPHMHREYMLMDTQPGEKVASGVLFAAQSSSLAFGP